ncbi:MAG: ROK family protein [Clostridiales Family XIII bacterium]|jgi:glucokinase|nr:ROK family protein [Clostridiales Family XIII bacterium]
MYSIGIDLGGTNIVAGLIRLDENGEASTLASHKIKTGNGTSDEMIANMGQLCFDVCDKAGIDIKDVKNVGIGVPGLANKKTGVVEVAVNIGWSDVPLRDKLKAITGLDVYIDNDANALAFSEYLIGGGKGYGTSLTVTLGTGIGGGFVEDGRIYTGFNYAGFEIGHIVIERGGRPCPCGREGCWERYASATGLIMTAQDYMIDHPESKMWELASGDITKVEGKTVFDAADLGDTTAKAVVTSYIEAVAVGLINMINLLQPDICIITGGIARQGDRLLKPLLAICEKEVFSRNSPHNTQIVMSKLDDHVSVIGPALLYMEKTITD